MARAKPHYVPGHIWHIPVKYAPGLTGVGREGFVEMTRLEPGIQAKGWKVHDGIEAYKLREPQVSYPEVFDTKNADIGAGNSYFWNTNRGISI